MMSGLLFLLLLTITAFVLAWWLIFNAWGDVKLNLKSFRDIYTTNPKRFCLYEWDRLAYMGDNGIPIAYIQLTFPAFIWFQMSRYSKKSEEMLSRKDILRKQVLECHQRDLHGESNKETNSEFPF